MAGRSIQFCPYCGTKRATRKKACASCGADLAALTAPARAEAPALAPVVRPPSPFVPPPPASMGGPLPVVLGITRREELVGAASEAPTLPAAAPVAPAPPPPPAPLAPRRRCRCCIVLSLALVAVIVTVVVAAIVAYSGGYLTFSPSQPTPETIYVTPAPGGPTP